MVLLPARHYTKAPASTVTLSHERINRITYEICVLQALRERLRCKEIWVVGANRYRNPDDDLPADFEAERTPYYAALNLPLEAERFIEGHKAIDTQVIQMAAGDTNVGFRPSRRGNATAFCSHSKSA